MEAKQSFFASAVESKTSLLMLGKEMVNLD